MKMKKTLLFLFAVMIAAVAYADTPAYTHYRNALIMAYSPVNSTYEDDNIKLDIYNGCLWIANKTNKTIFLDLSQCFAVHNGASYPMYDQVRDEKNSSKAKTTTSIDEFKSIAPQIGVKQNETFVCNLAETGLYRTYNTVESKQSDFSDYELRFMNLMADMVAESQKANPKEKKKFKGVVSRHLTEEESIDNIGASIAYAFSKRSENWTSVTLTTWVSDVIFAPYYISFPKDLKKNEKKGFNVKETAPAVVHIKADSPFEFDKDKSPIIACDWTGDYNKGTFELQTIHVVKEKGQNIFKQLAGWTGVALGQFYAIGLIVPEQIYYKDVYQFDGTQANWGELIYNSKREFKEKPDYLEAGDMFSGQD